MLLHRRASHLARRFVRHTQSHGRPSARRAEVTRRTGALAVKVGMVGAWDDSGRRHALTALHVDNCRVVQVKTEAKERYTALQLGAGSKKAKRLNRSERGHFIAGDLPFSAELTEFRVSPDAILPVGTAIGASLKTNTTLKHLTMENNPLSKRKDGSTDYGGLANLAGCFPHNKTLVSLNLWRCNIGKEGGMAFEKALEKNDTLVFLEVGINSNLLNILESIITNP